MKDKQDGGVDPCKDMKGHATSRRTFSVQQGPRGTVTLVL